MNRRYPLLILVILISISMAVSLFRYDLLWVFTGLFILFLFLGIWRRSDSEKLSRDIVLMLSIPLLIGAFGISERFGESIYEMDLAFAAILPIVSFMIVINLCYHTDFRSNLMFTSWLNILFSMAIANLYGIGRFFSDQYLDTAHLVGNDPWMIELFVFTMIAVVLGICIYKYLNIKQYPSLAGINNQTGKLKFDIKNDLNVVLQRSFNLGDHPWMIYAARIFQICIVILTIYAFINLKVKDGITGLISIAFTTVPYLYHRRTSNTFPKMLFLWICIALFLHVLGGAGGLYEFYPRWDHVTHLISGTLVAALVYTFLVYLNCSVKDIHMPFKQTLGLVLILMLSIGVIWELYEYFGDLIFDTEMQESLYETAYDMVFNVIGAMITVIVFFLKGRRIDDDSR